MFGGSPFSFALAQTKDGKRSYSALDSDYDQLQSSDGPRPKHQMNQKVSQHARSLPHFPDCPLDPSLTLLLLPPPTPAHVTPLTPDDKPFQPVKPADDKPADDKPAGDEPAGRRRLRVHPSDEPFQPAVAGPSSDEPFHPAVDKTAVYKPAVAGPTGPRG